MLNAREQFPEIVELLNALPEQYSDENYTPLLYVGMHLCGLRAPH
jgi:hypothetical protein